MAECVKVLRVEICEMGATKRRCRSYVEACVDAGLLRIDGLRFKITEDGKNWIARKT